MSTKEKWRALGIINSSDLVKRYVEETGKVGVYLSYSYATNARYDMGKPTGWGVIRPGYRTDKDAHWAHHGNKYFLNFSYKYDKTLALMAAMNWTDERYKLSGEWGKVTGFGTDWFPKEISDWAKTYLKEQS